MEQRSEKERRVLLPQMDDASRVHTQNDIYY